MADNCEEVFVSQIANWLVPVALVIVLAIALPYKFDTDVVYVDQANVMEKLRISNPAHYEKIRQILAGVDDQQDTEIPRWIRSSFNGRDVELSGLLLTSYPPKKRLSFVLENRRYEALVVR
jgi:hypothetical protein